MARRLTELQAQEIGARLREAREARGWSLSQAGNACQMHHAHVSRCESGKFRFMRGHALDLCKLFDICADSERKAPTVGGDLHEQLASLLRAKPAAAPALKAFFDILQSVVEEGSSIR